jgi:hypothetical protein
VEQTGHAGLLLLSVAPAEETAIFAERHDPALTGVSGGTHTGGSQTVGQTAEM